MSCKKKNVAQSLTILAGGIACATLGVGAVIAAPVELIGLGLIGVATVYAANKMEDKDHSHEGE